LRLRGRLVVQPTKLKPVGEPRRDDAREGARNETRPYGQRLQGQQVDDIDLPGRLLNRSPDPSGSIETPLVAEGVIQAQQTELTVDGHSYRRDHRQRVQPIGPTRGGIVSPGILL